MLITPTISVDYSRLNDLKYLSLVNTLLTKLQGSSSYPSPTPTLGAYGELIKDYQVAVQAVKARVVGATFERDRTRGLLETATRELSAYAIDATPDRPDLWAEVGFPLTKSTRTPRTPAQPVTNFVLRDGDAKHSIAASVDRQVGMMVYAWRIRPKNGPAGRFCYETLLSHTPDIVIEGLDSETAYCVECAAWNDSGPLQWSDALTRIVQ